MQDPAVTRPSAAPAWRPIRWGPGALVVVATVAAFLPTLDNGFLSSWDDPANFADNPHYRGLGPSRLIWMLTTFHMGHWIPLTWMTLGLDYLIWGMNPRGYHATSLALHAATALVLYLVAFRLLRLALPGAREPDLRWGAAAAALFWAMHPLRAESVAWATERRDVLSGFLYAAAVWAYLGASEPGAPSSRGRYWAAFALFTGALLSKSITVTLPVALLVLDVYPLRRLGGRRGWREPRVWLEKAPFFAAAAAVSAVAFWALFTLGNIATLEGMGIGQRLVLAVYGLGFYLWKTLVPLPLSPFYPFDVHVSWLHFAAVIAATLVATLCWRRWPAFTAVWAVYTVTLLPVLGVFQNGPQPVADRYTYLASMGWMVLVGAGMARRWAGVNVVRAVAVVWVVALAWLTWQQVGIWRNSATLWTQVTVLYPESRVGHFNLAEAYEREGRYAEALAHYSEVKRLSRGHPRWYVPIGRMYELSGVGAEALRFYRRALSESPRLPEACEAARRLAAVLGERLPELETCPRGPA
ncbi:MAG TPA: tetratricopeptide repeat protein [Methylomirabilota bacterium]|nr:tetratricopeptide repeat protein [Methylomirabilota bacterium]